MSAKKISIIVLIAVFVGFGAWFGYQYYVTQPARVASNFLNSIAKNGNYTAAYEMTSPAYKQEVPFSQFVSALKPLDKSEIDVSNLGTKMVNDKAVTGGLLNDLGGTNYDYIVTLSRSGASWKINAILVNKE